MLVSVGNHVSLEFQRWCYESRFLVPLVAYELDFLDVLPVAEEFVVFLHVVGHESVYLRVVGHLDVCVGLDAAFL